MEKEKIMEAIELAVEIDNIEMFEILLKDFDLNALDEDDRNYIYTIVIANAKSLRFVNRVLDLGCGINNVIEGKNLLHIAAVSNCVESIKFFLEKGLDIEAKSDDDVGFTPLMLAACTNDSTEVIQFLIDKGADINALTSDGENLLHLSAGCNENPDVLKFFIDKFDIESRDNNGLTPLLSAAQAQENLEVIKLLVDSGADMHAKGKRGETVFHLAAMNKNPDIADYFEELFRAFEVTDDGQTVIETALLKGESEETINICFRKMITDMFIAAAHNENPCALKVLLDKGFSFKYGCGDNGFTLPMTAAAYSPNPDVLLFALEHERKIDAVDEDGRNLAHYAACNESTEMFEFVKDEELFKELLSHRDKKGNLPEYYLEHKDEF
ncbi:MAG: ankyrin repeat domain-containing protein [Anaerobutyricum hallii]|uniref:ankyrin repeat domain-containing protein n=1 Tax=Anaerobutyricum hallii TaxID=39488 RepID=UPI002A810977|nr:ankyrin repeat domain-containing protein [Anaerobutyricum hallii]MDY4576468.1 ankyrin repeat domain-containing protein [Anaerobutyricum hallii]